MHAAFKEYGLDMYYDVPKDCAEWACSMARSKCPWISNGTEPPFGAHDIEIEAAEKAVIAALEVFQLIDRPNLAFSRKHLVSNSPATQLVQEPAEEPMRRD